MAWLTANSDLRTLLADNPTDRYRYRKRCLGNPNGTNKYFKTFESRRSTNFTATGVDPFLGVFVSGTKVTVSVDDPIKGELILAVAPVDGDSVEASYYIQWFLDQDLASFLSSTATWVGVGSDYNQIPPSFYPLALQYAASLAYQSLALKWSERVSDAYQVSDKDGKDAQSAAQAFKSLADDFFKSAQEQRNDYYTRQGQSSAPIRAYAIGNVPNLTPKR